MTAHATTLPAITFVVYEDREVGWRWRLLRTNGRVLADSGESYTRKFDALRAVQMITRLIKELA